VEAGGLNIEKFIDVFERNTEKSAGEDIRRVEYNQMMGTITVNFHFGKNRITSNSLVYHKQNKKIVSSGEEDRRRHIQKLFKKITEKERTTFASIRENEQDFNALLDVLSYQRKKVELKMDPYTVARLAVMTNQDVTDADMNNMKNKNQWHASPFDDLSMFMPVKRIGKKMSKDECFGLLKERLIHRLDILLRRKDRDLKEIERVAHLSKIHLNSMENGDVMRMRQMKHHGAEMLKEAKTLKEKLFVTEKRIRWHEKKSIEKLKTLNARLTDHPLL